MTDCLDVGYISNSHSRWYGWPALPEYLFHPVADRPTSDYRSTHGVTAGRHAPSECGEWWYRFFRRSPTYVTLDDVGEKELERFRRSVASLTNAFNKPILFKNLYASLRIQAVAKSLPESLFIVTHRDEVDNGHSLLETRKNVYGSYEKWWSMEPPNAARLQQLPAWEQVIEQVRSIHDVIDRDLDLAGVGADRRFDLHYESFCENPKESLAELQAFLKKNGCEVDSREAPPSAFSRRREVRISPDLFENMVKYASGL